MGLVVLHEGVPPPICLGSERSGLLVPSPGPAARGFRAPRPVWNVPVPYPGRLMKNAHLLRYTRPSSLRRTSVYASFLRTSCALHLGILAQPALRGLFFRPLTGLIGTRDGPPRVALRPSPPEHPRAFLRGPMIEPSMATFTYRTASSRANPKGEITKSPPPFTFSL